MARKHEPDQRNCFFWKVPFSLRIFFYEINVPKSVVDNALFEEIIATRCHSFCCFLPICEPRFSFFKHVLSHF